MKNVTNTLVSIVFILVLNTSLAAQEQKFSLEGSYGYQYVPGFLFTLDKSVTKHPDSFSGFYRDFSFYYSLNERWALGLTLLDANTTGNGQWGRTSMMDEFQQNGVDGIVSGRTDMKNRGFTFNLKRTFRGDKKLQPYLQFGTGLGWLNVRFNGQFVGHETESGMNFPVVSDAGDNMSRKIPLLNLEGGAQYRLTKHLYLSAAPYWNTGFGAKLGLAIKF